MLDAFTRAMRKSPSTIGYIPNYSVAEMSPPGTRLRREPDGPVSMNTGANFHVPSPFRVGYETIFLYGILNL